MDEPEQIDLALAPPFRIGRLTVEPSLRQASSASGAHILEPRVLQVLVALVMGNGRIVSRDALVRQCWNGRIVGDDAINRVIGRLRRLAEDAADDSFRIETVPRVGYRLIGDSALLAPEGLAGDMASAAPKDDLAGSPDRAEFGGGTQPKLDRNRRWVITAASAIGLAAVAGILVWGPLGKTQPPPSMRSIAILPVRNLSGDPALDATADALTEDAFDLQGHTGAMPAPPLSAILATRAQPSGDLAKGRNLHVRYVVSSSLRKASPGLNLSYRVLDTADGHLLATGEYVNAAPDVALAERRLVLKLFYGMGSLITPKFIADQLSKPIDDRDPENVYARVLDKWSDLRRGDLPRVEHVIAAAKAIPDTADLKASLDVMSCLTYYTMIASGYAASPTERRQWADDALDLGSRAAVLKPTATDPHVCRVYAFMALQRWDEAMAEAKHLLEMSPNSADAYEDIAEVEFARGQFQDAVRDYTENAERREQGNPIELGVAYLFAGDYGPAIENFREFEVQAPKVPAAPFFDAAALELSGRHEEALAEADLYRRLKPDGSDWAIVESHEPAFLAALSRVRGALHQVGLDGPSASPIDPKSGRSRP